MYTFVHRCGSAGLIGLVFALAGATPAAAQQMTWIGYKNETPFVVAVQGSSQGANGMVNRGTPHNINPKEAAWDQVRPGNKTITVYDPRQPNRIFFQGPVTLADKNLFFSIQPDGVGPDKVPRVKFVPIAPPAMMPKR